MKFLRSLFLLLISALLFLNGTTKGKCESVEEFFDGLNDRLNVEYTIKIDDRGNVSFVPYAEGKRNGSAYFYSPGHYNQLKFNDGDWLIKNYRNDTLCGCCISLSCREDWIYILNDIRVNTDYPTDQNIIYRNSPEIIYQAYLYDYPVFLKEYHDSWVIFPEDEIEMGVAEVGIGYKHNRSDTVFYSVDRLKFLNEDDWYDACSEENNRTSIDSIAHEYANFKTYYDYFRLIERTLDVEYKIVADDSTGIFIVPYREGKRNGTQINLYPIYPNSENRRIQLKEILNFKNDTLTGTSVMFDPKGDVKSIISQIKVNTDFLPEQKLMYGRTDEIVYQGYRMDFSATDTISSESRFLFTESDMEMRNNEVGIGFRNNRSDTIDFSRNPRCSHRY